MWRETATAVFPGVGLREPAQASELVAAQARLRRTLPAELQHLLLESNGVIGHAQVDTVWPIDQIVETNLHFWSDQTFTQLYMTFDPLLFFGDNGGGDQFAFVQKPERPDIFVWEHESDSRRWVANNLQDYLGRSLRHEGDDWYQL
ncbi:SMI1/KNR4 family protein [Streptomyces justiciae]|uniref:SMI1/KNR4 family protein n=1 Tax=Streptomyces justiciae TaxID=2780140 RepID=A0ABU3LVY7_9ACTN|nr:SMI1/KNR4 family protein [Streptomyces justiciae]MDT7843392.1 SMI1/KNR4 family protein [Streptomyces justiciae]